MCRWWNRYMGKWVGNGGVGGRLQCLNWLTHIITDVLAILKWIWRARNMLGDCLPRYIFFNDFGQHFVCYFVFEGEYINYNFSHLFIDRVNDCLNENHGLLEDLKTLIDIVDRAGILSWALNLLWQVSKHYQHKLVLFACLFVLFLNVLVNN